MAPEELASWLKEQGYEVVESFQGYRFWKVNGKNIMGGFCEPNGQSYTQIDGKFAADHENCFDKFSKCPLIVELDAIDTTELKKHLDFLGSEAGLKHSDTYEYLDPENQILPRSC